ncbi:MAG TPA: hypothetical protein VFI91_10050 [Longimicrobiaceae bacterium]|nr:hypothetical protein [Longimicrobiaceae bacterium]
MTETLLSLAAALLLTTVHAVSPLMRVLREIPRSRVLSFAGGMSLSWVVMRVMPSLSTDQFVLARAAGSGSLDFLRSHVYIAVLVSVLFFYSIERLAKGSRLRRERTGDADIDAPIVFWVQISSFAMLNFMIGYALPSRAERGLEILLLFALAMALKFMVSDHGLYADHGTAYHRVGRWILGLAVLLGWATGYLTEIPDIGAALLRAFIAGGVLFNMLKEELPAERESKAWAFVAGAVAYAGLLIVVT